MNKIILLLIALAVIGGGAYFYTTLPQDVPREASTEAQATSTPNTEQQAPPANSSETAGVFTMAVVAEHDSSASCYSVIRGDVYDLTSFIGEHPGGSDEILKICGRDGTRAFTEEHGGMALQENALTGFKIGALAR